MLIVANSLAIKEGKFVVIDTDRICLIVHSLIGRALHLSLDLLIFELVAVVCLDDTLFNYKGRV